MSSSVADNETPVRAHRRVLTYAPAASIFVIGALARVGSILLSAGGVRGDYGYDASVYYAAADSFIHGRMPYQNFLLLHPPGVMFAVVPFAALGTVTTDLTGFVAGNLAFALLGAFNGVLVYLIARRLGLSVSSAWLGGVFYGVWAGAVFVELSSRLEPLGSFAFLCGMLALTGGRVGRRHAVLGGMALGFAVCVKVWWLLPLVVVAGWLWRESDGKRRLRAFLAGAVAVVAVVVGPFLLLAPRAMTHMIVLDQLGRDGQASLAARFLTFSTAPVAVLHIRGVASAACSVIFTVIFVGICIAAWRYKAARIFVVLAVAHLLLLVVTPSFFATYMDFVAPPLALTVAAAAHARIRRHSMRPVIAGVLVGTTAITAGGTFAHPDIAILPFPTRQLAGHLPTARCVTSITPLPLIELNVLSRNLARGCRQWVDSYGRTYGVDKSGNLPRDENAKWQKDLRHYLLSGGAIVLDRPDESVGSSTLHMFAHNPRLARIDRAEATYRDRTYTFTIYAVAPKGRAGHTRSR